MCSNCRDYEGPYDDGEEEAEDYVRKRNRFWLRMMTFVLLYLLGLRKWMQAIWQ